MSRISQDFINSVEYLYGEISIQQNDFLNEESQYYDDEASELVEDIIATISTSMVYEGYSANAVIGFLADSSEYDITEKYLSFDESTITESKVSEDYIVEQLEIFDVAIDEGLADKLLGGAIKLAGRVASKPARMRVDKILSGSKNPERARELLQKTAQKSARNANAGGYSSTMSPVDGKKLTGKQSAELLSKAKLNQATQKVKDIAKGAKAALPGIAKGALIGGTGVLAGYAGAKLGSGDGKVGPKIVGPKLVGPKIVGPKSSSTPSGSGGGGSAPSGTGGGSRSSTPPSASPKPSPTKPKAPEGETAMQKWARLHPNLASKVKPSQSGYDEISATRTKPGPNEKQDQTPTQGSPDAKIDTKAVDDAMKAQKERDQKRSKPQAVNASYEYDAYDLVLEYLLSQGHVETVEEANYVMLVMDAEFVGDIVEEHKNDLLAEEISEWIDALVEDGYDLSEYTWDDLAEYYVNEAREDDDLSPLQKIRKRNKSYFESDPTATQKTTQRRGERKSERGSKKPKGDKSAFGTMKNVGGPYN